MITASQNADFVLAYFVNQAMFVIDPPGPATTEFPLQRFRFSDAGEWFALDFPDQPKNSERLNPILLYPPSQILERCGIKFQASQLQPRAKFPADVLSLLEDGVSLLQN